jgi:hypothetical protein
MIKFRDVWNFGFWKPIISLATSNSFNDI